MTVERDESRSVLYLFSKIYILKCIRNANAVDFPADANTPEPMLGSISVTAY